MCATDDVSGWMFGDHRAAGGRVTARIAVEQPSVDLGLLTAPDIEQPPPSWLCVPAEDRFIGRRTELNALDQELRAGVTRRAAASYWWKALRESARPRLSVGSSRAAVACGHSGAVAEEGEAAVSYALVDQLLGALGLFRSTLLRHPDPTSPVEQPIEVGRLLLMALRGLAERCPVVLVLDDIQWADRDSLRSVLFVAA